jgi:uncharacterized coiled-coil protein SlyX
MRPAFFTTDEPPTPVDNVELAEYIAALRRRIEVQTSLMDALATEVTQHRSALDTLTHTANYLTRELAKYTAEVEKLSLDLAFKDNTLGPQWTRTK